MVRIGGAGPTPKPRTTLFSALSYYPNSLWECVQGNNSKRANLYGLTKIN